METEPQNNEPFSANDILPQESFGAGQPRALVPIPVIESQDTLSLDEYVRYGDSKIVPTLRESEAEMVKAFISGMSDSDKQGVMTEHLHRTGWTWNNAKAELPRTAQNAKTRQGIETKRRRVLPDRIEKRRTSPRTLAGRVNMLRGN